jgi:sporulation protein YlmC with PRC-barrel domain
MQPKSRQTSKTLLGKTIVTKSGKTLGKVGDLIFEVRTGELLNIVLTTPTNYATAVDLEIDKAGRQMIPFSSVIAVEDFLIISEEDLL